MVLLCASAIADITATVATPSSWANSKNYNRPNTMGSKASPQARLLFKDAFDKLEQAINANHPIKARNFHSMTIQDVHTATKQIEQELGARQCLRNMRRIEHFFAGLEKYSKAVDVLCNGTPYLPWIWAPVKLVLQVSMKQG